MSSLHLYRKKAEQTENQELFLGLQRSEVLENTATPNAEFEVNQETQLPALEDILGPAPQADTLPITRQD